MKSVIFSAQEVRATLDGSKTQFRRIMSNQPIGQAYAPAFVRRVDDGFQWYGELGESSVFRCPFGKVGDKIFVKETIGRRKASFFGIEATNGVESAFYVADGEDVCNEHDFNLCPWWRGKGRLSAQLMPEFASRLKIQNEEIRVQRAHDISEADCLAEGILKVGNKFIVKCLSELKYENKVFDRAIDAFRFQYGLLNGEFAWNRNPFVWAVSYKRGV